MGSLYLELLKYAIGDGKDNGIVRCLYIYVYTAKSINMVEDVITLSGKIGINKVVLF